MLQSGSFLNGLSREAHHQTRTTVDHGSFFERNRRRSSNYRGDDANWNACYRRRDSTAGTSRTHFYRKLRCVHNLLVVRRLAVKKTWHAVALLQIVTMMFLWTGNKHL